MEDYIVHEAKLGNRSVVFYGETSYWVNVDTDVPLFLPLYGQRRQHDLRRIAGREIAENFKIQGQMNFDSGWEWGYWLSDVVTARSSWDPLLSKLSGKGLNYKESDDQWDVFSIALKPITKIFGNEYGVRFNDIIVKLAQSQESLLIKGEIDGNKSPNLYKLSGIAYLSGDDTWVDLPRKFGLHFLQPDKVHFKEIDDPDWVHALLLLNEMERIFKPIADSMSLLLSDAILYSSSNNICINNANDNNNSSTCIVNDDNNNINNNMGIFQLEKQYKLNEAAIKLLQEFDDCIRILVMRITHVRMLYESRDPIKSPTDDLRKSLQLQSRDVITNATLIVANREASYRVPWQRIAAWRENPTVYRYGYVWSVHSLYYWWRAQGVAEEESFQSEWSPCYLNRMDISEIAIGWGKIPLEILRNFINNYLPFSFDFVNCLSPPSSEYTFPRDLSPR
jgi:hypothetical protein